MLDKVFKRLQHHSTFREQRKCYMGLNESLNRFKFDSTPKKKLSTMLDDLFKRSQHLVQESVEHMLTRMLKPLKRAFMQSWIQTALILEPNFPL